ncbi:fibronectin type III domain-containing protein [Terrabacter terrigena]|uniref:Fibronectin type III domain-containing protein n=1 Tax=Terrabacter terrigena TaxID=574718 RepID=A0ABW3MU09_9MICO
MGATAALGLAFGPILALAGSASAAVPTFPNNIAVFPDRDFVSIEGYAEHAGETATIKVTRPGVGVVGSATGLVSGTDVAFEVNHPGGVCWGNGTGLNVTPDIIAGDKVSITFPDGSSDDTTTSSSTVTHDMVQNGTTITVDGTFNEDPTSALPVVNRDFLEQRIIQPDLVPIIGKRDIRAVPGPLTPAPKGGYSSMLQFPSTGHFRATYVFDTQEAADVAAAADLGERAMNWEVQDADGNRQGLTIAEFGEPGGPGMGGCPAGPADQTAPAGTASVVRTGATALVKWTAVSAVPTADPVTGYSVEAITAPDVTTGAQSTSGVRLGVSATQTTLTGLDTTKTYSFEVRSMAGAKLSIPFRMGATDTVAPTLSVTPQGGIPTAPVQANSVSVSSNGQVFFTTDGSPVVSAGLPSDSAQLLTGTSIPVTAPVTLHIVAFDQVGNISSVFEGSFSPVTAVAPPVPTGLAGTPTQNSVALTWNPAPTGATVTGWQVSVYNGAGAKLATQPPVTTVPRQTITGLTANTAYQFSVKALNAGAVSLDTTLVSVRTQVATDRITISTAKWKVGDFKVVGTGDQVGATVRLYRVNADSSIGTEISGSATAVVAAAPPGIGDWTVRMRANAPGTNPGRVIAKSDRGGQTAPFTVSNG